jgi:hypothetical protein
MSNGQGFGKVRKKLAALGLGVLLFQLPFGGCEFDQITATSTVTLDAREVMISAIRGAILTPIDTFITNGVNQVFDELDNDE